MYDRLGLFILLSEKKSAGGRGGKESYRSLGLYVVIRSFRIRHILQHHFADLQRRLSKSDFQDLNVTPLRKVEKSASSKIIARSFSRHEPPFRTFRPE